MKTNKYLSNDQKIPVHQWTNGSEHVSIVRCVGQDGKTYCGFQNPLEVGATLIVPDQWEPIWGPQPAIWRPGWIPDHQCGGGIHGWAWGIATGDGKEPDWTAIWQVYECKPGDVIGDVDGMKVKFRTGILRYSGDWQGVNHYVLAGQMAWVFHNARGSASNSGDNGSASNSGDNCSASNSGANGSASNSGARGSASNSGYRGSASNSGDNGSASNSGDRGSASNSGSKGSASNSGANGSASNSGDNGSASNSGDNGSASNSGYNGSAKSLMSATAAISTGFDSRVMAEIG